MSSIKQTGLTFLARLYWKPWQAVALGGIIGCVIGTIPLLRSPPAGRGLSQDVFEAVILRQDENGNPSVRSLQVERKQGDEINVHGQRRVGRGSAVKYLPFCFETSGEFSPRDTQVFLPFKPATIIDYLNAAKVIRPTLVFKIRPTAADAAKISAIGASIGAGYWLMLHFVLRRCGIIQPPMNNVAGAHKNQNREPNSQGKQITQGEIKQLDEVIAHMNEQIQEIKVLPAQSSPGKRAATETVRPLEKIEPDDGETNLPKSDAPKKDFHGAFYPTEAHRTDEPS